MVVLLEHIRQKLKNIYQKGRELDTMKIRKWEKCLAKYEKLYKAHIREKKKEIPNLIELLEHFDVEIYKPTKIYKFMSKIEDKIEKDLKLSKKQENLFEYWRECEDNRSNDLVECAFIYGYSFAMGLKEECNNLLKT